MGAFTPDQLRELQGILDSRDKQLEQKIDKAVCGAMKRTRNYLVPTQTMRCFEQLFAHMLHWQRPELFDEELQVLVDRRQFKLSKRLIKGIEKNKGSTANLMKSLDDMEALSPLLIALGITIEELAQELLGRFESTPSRDAHYREVPLTKPESYERVYR